MKAEYNATRSDPACAKELASNSGMGKNWPSILMLVIAGVIYGVVGVPWANAYGHWWISVIFYAALVVAAIYCRCNREPIHSKVFQRKIRRTPQSL